MSNNTIFNPTERFQEYCLEHVGKELLFDGTTLLIKIPFAPDTHNRFLPGTLVECDERPTAEKISDLSSVLNQLIVPKGLELCLDFSKEKPPIYEINKTWLKVTFPDKAVLTPFAPLKLILIATEFFRLMVATNQSKFTLDPNCSLVFMNLRDIIVLERSPQEAFNLIKQYALPSGFRISSSGSADIKIVANALHINNSQALSFSISPTTNHNYTTGSFVETLLLIPTKKLEIPADTPLIIKGVDIYAIREHYNKSWSHLQPTPSEPLFILNQLFLHWGYHVTVTSNGNAIPKPTIQDDTLTIVSPLSFTISLNPSISNKIDLTLLSHNMTLSGGPTTITIPANTNTLFSRIPTDLITRSKPNEESITAAIQETFLSESCSGFNWEIEFLKESKTPFRLEYKSIQHKDQSWLALECGVPFKLSLTLPKEPSQFALSIVQSLNSSLAESLLERSVEAFQNLLFKSIFHFCFQRFYRLGLWKIPTNFFKKKTINKLQEIITNPEFLHHLYACMRSGKSLLILRQIQWATPEEFDQIGTITDPSVAFIVNKIQNIASEELQGSNYLNIATAAIVNTVKKKG